MVRWKALNEYPDRQLDYEKQVNLTTYPVDSDDGKTIVTKL